MIGLYRGFVRSVVDYAAVALGHMSESQIKRLGVVETTGLRTCLGVFYGAWNVALYAEAYEVPIRHRWQRVRTKLAATRARHGRADASTVNDNEFERHAKRWGEAEEIDKRRSATIKDWFPKQPKRKGDRVPFWEEGRVVTAGPCAVMRTKKSNMSCQELKQAGLAVVHEVTATADLVMYTDGSNRTDGTGAAFWGQRPGAEWSGSLPEWSGVLTAETVAIERAVRWVADEGSDGMNL